MQNPPCWVLGSPAQERWGAGLICQPFPPVPAQAGLELSSVSTGEGMRMEVVPWLRSLLGKPGRPKGDLCATCLEPQRAERRAHSLTRAVLTTPSSSPGDLGHARMRKDPLPQKPMSLAWEEPALGNGRRWRESYEELAGTGESACQGVALGAVQGRACHSVCASTSMFSRSLVLVKPKCRAVAFILEKHLHLRRFKLEGDS